MILSTVRTKCNHPMRHARNLEFWIETPKSGKHINLGLLTTIKHTHTHSHSFRKPTCIRLFALWLWLIIVRLAVPNTFTICSIPNFEHSGTAAAGLLPAMWACGSLGQYSVQHPLSLHLNLGQVTRQDPITQEPCSAPSFAKFSANVLHHLTIRSTAKETVSRILLNKRFPLSHSWADDQHTKPVWLHISILLQ